MVYVWSLIDLFVNMSDESIFLKVKNAILACSIVYFNINLLK